MVGAERPSAHTMYCDLKTAWVVLELILGFVFFIGRDRARTVGPEEMTLTSRCPREHNQKLNSTSLPVIVPV